MSGFVCQGDLQSQLAAFVFTHGYKIELTISTVWGQDDQDFSLTLSFESLEERDNFRSAFLSAREQWNNGALVSSPVLVSASLFADSQPVAALPDGKAGEDANGAKSTGTCSPSSPVQVGGVLRVMQAAKVRAHPALDSEQVGMLLTDERILVLEVVTLSSTVEFHADQTDEHESEDEVLVQNVRQSTDRRVEHGQAGNNRSDGDGKGSLPTTIH